MVQKKKKNEETPKIIVNDRRHWINEEDNEEIVHESFVGSKLKTFNIDLSERVRETVMNCCVYGSFLMSYCLMSV